VPLKSGCENNSPLDFVYLCMRLCLIPILALASLCGDAVAQNVAIADATVYLSPGVPAKTHATILIHAGKIVGIGSKLGIPSGLRVLRCDGCIVFAGFWNTHVHFTGPQWDNADRVPADQLSRDMQSMLTHSGFTTVVDLSSDPNNTTALRRRVESGEVAGPRIYTAGFGLYEEASRAMSLAGQPATPATAVEAVQQHQALGSDVVNLFTGSYLTPDNIAHMPLDVARAAVSEGHRHSQQHSRRDLQPKPASHVQKKTTHADRFMDSFDSVDELLRCAAITLALKAASNYRLRHRTEIWNDG
jgi:Amidohydrolase family